MTENAASGLANEVRSAVANYFTLVIAVIRDGAEPDADPHKFLGRWEDWIGAKGGELIPAILSVAERSAYLAYHSAWVDAVMETPDDARSMRDIRRRPQWLRLAEAADHALAELRSAS